MKKDNKKIASEKQINKNENLEQDSPSESKKPKLNKKKIIICVIVGIIVLLVGALILLANVGNNKTEDPIEKLQIDDNDVKQADDYLLNKYNTKFTRTLSEFDSKELYKSSNYLTISIDYVDAQGFKFTYRAHKFDNEDWKMSDNYQCLQYINQIDNIVKSNFGVVDSTNSSATGTSTKFTSIEDFYQNYNEYYFVIYLKQDKFGELNNDTAMEFSKKIHEIIPFKTCSFMYTSVWTEQINGINYSRHGNPVNISFSNNEFSIPSMERVQEKADALNKAIDEEIEKSRNNSQ